MSYDTVNDDLRDLIDLSQPRNIYSSTYGYVHPDERTCAHCVRNEACWRHNQAERVPINFSFRSGWDANRFGRHMWGVVGQICGRFEHSNSSINARHERAERRRRDENGEGNEWDTEVN